VKTTSVKDGAARRLARGTIALLCCAAVAGTVPAAHAQATAPTPLKYGPPTGMPWFNLPEVSQPVPIRPNAAGVYGLEHTHVITANIEKSMHFYVDILGFDQVMDIQDIGKDPPMNARMNTLLGFKNATFRHAIVTMPGGASYGTHVPQIEFWEVHGVPLDATLNRNPTGNLQGKGYNAYMVTDLPAILAKMKAENIRFVSDMLVSPRGKSIYVVDPDGQIIELNERVNP
jgi:catechol 2,3-dioxygenase-like lactoylglutathione lyase family enzyme